MANKRYTNTIDSFGVDEHMLRVSGRVNVLHSDASEMPYDGEVLIVMLGRMTAPSYSETKDGDVIRVNVMKPIEVKVVKDIKTRRKIMEGQNFEHEAQMIFTDMAVGSGAETGPSESPITLLDLQNEARKVLEVDPDIDSADVEITGGFDPSTEIDTTVLGEPEEDGQWVDGIFVPSWVGQEAPITGYDDEYDDQPLLADEPIEEDFTVEGEPEPAVVEEPPVETEPVEPELSDEDEAAFLRQFMSQRAPATTAPAEEAEEVGRRVRVGGQAEHDDVLKKFLESGQ